MKVILLSELLAEAMVDLKGNHILWEADHGSSFLRIVSVTIVAYAGGKHRVEMSLGADEPPPELPGGLTQEQIDAVA